MRRLSYLVTIACLLVVGVIGLCPGDPQSPGSPSSQGGMPVVQAIAGFVVQPWATALLLFLGMMLLISQLTAISTWGATGTVGVLCVGLVFASYIAAGVAVWMGAALLFAGLALLLIEAGIMPGRGISAFAGLACLFLGSYWMLGGAAAGTFFAVSVSALFALMSFAAFLVHLPQNGAWRALCERIEISVARPYSTAVDSESIQVSETGTVQKVVMPEAETSARPEAARPDLKQKTETGKGRTDSQTDEEQPKQQIVGTGEDE